MISRVLVFLPALSLFAQAPANLPPLSTFLKANVSVRQIATDSKGFIYMLGATAPSGSNAFPNQLFVARLDPATASQTYTSYLTPGADPSLAIFAAGLAVDAAGNAYVAWYSSNANRALPGPSSGDTPWVTKIDSNGNTVYSFQFSNGAKAEPQGIAVDSQGEVIVSGNVEDSTFPATQGAYNNPWGPNLPFTTKIDANGAHLIFSALGVGGSSLALDGAGNVFIAGTWTTAMPPQNPQYPTTSGAFQRSYNQYNVCVLPAECSNVAGEQYVTKLSADGSALIYSTFVTGSQGAENGGMAIDATGDVWLTGDTNSPDYPVTNSGDITVSKTFTTELDPTGSKVLLSIPVGIPSRLGTIPSLNNLAIDSQGNIVVAGLFGPTLSPPDPPALPPAAPGASPHCVVAATSFVESAVYVMRLSSRDGSVLDTRVYPASLKSISSTLDSAGNIYLAGMAGLPNVPLTPGVVFDNAAVAPNVSGAWLARMNLSTPASAVGCVTDSTSATLIGPVAPGQLITIYGNNIGPEHPVAGIANDVTSVPTSLAGVMVTFDGQPAPILYASSTQINVQIPFEVATRASTNMQLSFNGSALGTRTFAVAPVNPALFTATDMPADQNCGGTTGGEPGQLAFAINEDGTLNSCANPAKVGSQITLFVNGIGATAPNSATGVLTGLQPGNVSASVTFAKNGEVGAFTNQAGAISGIAALTVRVPNTYPVEFGLSPLNIGVTMNGQTAGPLVQAVSNAAGTTGSAAQVVIFAEP